MSVWGLTTWSERELCVKTKFPSMTLASVRDYLARYPTFCAQLSDREKANIAIAKAQVEAQQQQGYQSTPSKPSSAALAVPKGTGVDFAKGFQNISSTLTKPVQLPVVGGVPLWAVLGGAAAVAYLLLFRKPKSAPAAGTP